MACLAWWTLSLVLICVPPGQGCDEKACNYGTAAGAAVGTTVAAVGGVLCGVTLGLGCAVAGIAGTAVAAGTTAGSELCRECGDGGDPHIANALDNLEEMLIKQKEQIRNISKEQLRSRLLNEQWFKKLSARQQELLAGQAILKLNQKNILENLSRSFSQMKELGTGIQKAQIISLYGEDITNLINIMDLFQVLEKDDLGQIINNYRSEEFLEYANDFRHGLKTSSKNLVRMLTSGHVLKTESLWSADKTFCTDDYKAYFLRMLAASFTLRTISLAMEGHQIEKREADRTIKGMFQINEQYAKDCECSNSLGENFETARHDLSKLNEFITKTTVSCGDSMASTCSACPGGEESCGGDCAWHGGVCRVSDILYLGDKTLVSLPSFRPVQRCSVPELPIKGLQNAVSGFIDNDLLICGGYASGYLSTCHRLHKGEWLPHYSMKSKRGTAAASQTSRGLFITGGYDYKILSTTEVLTSAGSAAGPPLPVGVYFHCQVTVETTDTVIVAGGNTDSTGISGTSAVYALTGQTWTPLQPMKYPRRGHSCTLVNNKILIVMGGSGRQDVEMYDVSTNTWTTGPSLPSDMDRGQAVSFNTQVNHHTQVIEVFAVYRDGKVLQLSDDWKNWNRLDNIAEWGVDGNNRPFFPAPLVNRKTLGC